MLFRLGFADNAHESLDGGATSSRMTEHRLWTRLVIVMALARLVSRPRHRHWIIYSARFPAACIFGFHRQQPQIGQVWPHFSISGRTILDVSVMIISQLPLTNTLGLNWNLH